MAERAFLILCVDAREPGDARVTGAGIFSEGPETLTLSHKRGVAYCEVYASEPRPSYAEAEHDVLEYIRDHRWEWCAALLAREWPGTP